MFPISTCRHSHVHTRMRLFRFIRSFKTNRFFLSRRGQGQKLLQRFQWFLNPRQVFDLTQGGPDMGLEMFRKVPQLRILACGGDGTAGWILSVLDRIGYQTTPAVGVLPLGTGNDLARTLGWGGVRITHKICFILFLFYSRVWFYFVRFNDQHAPP